ncbi:MAG: hypothetical protein CUN55_10665 [Phototrophicales bacterium]|nr:MAG: hypothetical protein CUN55_10665 [Phototrophicales bacterium]
MGSGVVVFVGVCVGGSGEGVKVVVMVGVGVIEGLMLWKMVGRGVGGNGFNCIEGLLIINNVILKTAIEAIKNKAVIPSKNGPNARLSERLGDFLVGLDLLIMTY